MMTRWLSVDGSFVQVGNLYDGECTEPAVGFRALQQEQGGDKDSPHKRAGRVSLAEQVSQGATAHSAVNSTSCCSTPTRGATSRLVRSVAMSPPGIGSDRCGA